MILKGLFKSVKADVCIPMKVGGKDYLLCGHTYRAMRLTSRICPHCKGKVCREAIDELEDY